MRNSEVFLPQIQKLNYKLYCIAYTEEKKWSQNEIAHSATTHGVLNTTLAPSFKSTAGLRN